jgi:hypothetical protein
MRYLELCVYTRSGIQRGGAQAVPPKTPFSPRVWQSTQRQPPA